MCIRDRHGRTLDTCYPEEDQPEWCLRHYVQSKTAWAMPDKSVKLTADVDLSEFGIELNGKEKKAESTSQQNDSGLVQQ